MILLAVLLAVTTPVASPAADEIVVTAEKLRRLRLSVATDDRGQVERCDVTVSSGDVAIDRKACEATSDCVAKGASSGGAVANCVDRRLIAFARTSHGQDPSGDQLQRESGE